jgi:hypothetical protein
VDDGHRDGAAHGQQRDQRRQRDRDTRAASLARGTGRRSRQSGLQLFAAPGKHLATEARDDRRDLFGWGRRASLLERFAK